MSDLRKRRLKFNREVMKSIRLFIPDNATGDPESIYLSRKLLAAYLLCQVNSVHYPYSVIDRYLRMYTILPKGIQAFLDKSLEVRFYWPDVMQEGAFYLVFNKETKGISYAVMNGAEHHTGEILEEKYKLLKDRLNRRGILSLKEVNFLIENVVIKRNHLPAFSEVHDPLSLRCFYDFLESSLNAQDDALRLVMHLTPFEDFCLEPPTQLSLDPLDCSDAESLVDELEATILHCRHQMDVSCGDLIGKIEQQDGIN